MALGLQLYVEFAQGYAQVTLVWSLSALDFTLFSASWCGNHVSSSLLCVHPVLLSAVLGMDTLSIGVNKGVELVLSSVGR